MNDEDILEYTRDILHKLIDEKGTEDEEVLYVSRELDKHIIEYYM